MTELFRLQNLYTCKPALTCTIRCLVSWLTHVCGHPLACGDARPRLTKLTNWFWLKFGCKNKHDFIFSVPFLFSTGFHPPFT